MQEKLEKVFKKPLEPFSTLEKAQQYFLQNQSWKRHNLPSYWTTFQNDQDLPVGILEYFAASNCQSGYDYHQENGNLFTSNYVLQLIELMAENGLKLSDKLKNKYSFYEFGYYIFLLKFDDKFLLNLIKPFYKKAPEETKSFFLANPNAVVRLDKQALDSFDFCKNYYLIKIETNALQKEQKKLEEQHPLSSNQKIIL